MRITNPMITNRMLVNISRNINLVDKYFTQASTGKVIQFASEGPIIAARALKFRTNVRETMQYQKNVSQGISWMGITEEGFSNLDKITTKIHELLTQGASDTYTLSDRKKIATDISSMVEQLGQEMNVTYAGRYVFSGYRTNKPPTLLDDSDKNYIVNQSFNLTDVENTFSYKKTDGITIPEIGNIKVLKLPYTNVANLSINQGALTVTELSEIDANAYNPAAGEVNYIKETGELVLGKDIYDSLVNGEIEVSYEASNLKKGDLNPEVYFTCKDITDPANPINYDMNNHDIEYEFGVSSRIAVNSLAKDVYTDKMFADLKGFLDLVNKVNYSDREALVNKFSTAPHNLSGSDLTNAVEKQLTEEEQAVKGLMQDRFSNMIEIVEDHVKVVETQRADLGSRMSRLELVESRLKEDELTYKTLMSKNEDVDYMDAIMNLNNAQAIYQASLQMGAKIIQTTLADFIR